MNNELANMFAFVCVKPKQWSQIRDMLFLL